MRATLALVALAIPADQNHVHVLAVASP